MSTFPNMLYRMPIVEQACRQNITGIFIFIFCLCQIVCVSVSPPPPPPHTHTHTHFLSICIARANACALNSMQSREKDRQRDWLTDRAERGSWKAFRALCLFSMARSAATGDDCNAVVYHRVLLVMVSIYLSSLYVSLSPCVSHFHKINVFSSSLFCFLFFLFFLFYLLRCTWSCWFVFLLNNNCYRKEKGSVTELIYYWISYYHLSLSLILKCFIKMWLIRSFSI